MSIFIRVTKLLVLLQGASAMKWGSSFALLARPGLVGSDNVTSLAEGTTENDPKWEGWYINMADDTERGKCMEVQIKEAGIKAMRYEGIKWPNTRDDGFASHDATKLKERGLHDCIEAGISMQQTAAHLNMRGILDVVRAHILSDWCAHKRILEMLAVRETDADYFLVFEDDVQLHPNFRQQIDHFVKNYKGNWSIAQVDPTAIGPVRWKIKAGLNRSHVGPAGYKSRIYHGGILSGSQAWIIKKEFIQDAVTQLKKAPAVPADHIGNYIDSMIAWKPRIATQPHYDSWVNQKCFAYTKAVSRSKISKLISDAMAEEAVADEPVQ